MTAEQDTLTEYVISLLDEGVGREEIEQRLEEKGHDERFVKAFVKEAIKLRYSKRRSQWLTLILSGAVICFISFLLTITSSFSASAFPIVLYGLTSVGILVVFTGFMKVF
jgi:hypothetical protein